MCAVTKLIDLFPKRSIVSYPLSICWVTVEELNHVLHVICKRAEPRKMSFYPDQSQTNWCVSPTYYGNTVMKQ